MAECSKKIEWTDAQTENLIDLFRLRECLWKTTCDLYSDRNERKDQESSMSAAAWVKEKSKKSGAGGVVKSKWWLQEKLLFLLDYVTPKNSAWQMGLPKTAVHRIQQGSSCKSSDMPLGHCLWYPSIVLHSLRSVLVWISRDESNMT